MAVIPQPNKTTAAAIHGLHAAREAGQAARAYLGWSALGDPCERALWYGFRWAGREAFDGRLVRLFDSGHREEARLLQELRDLGMEVWDRDASGGQFACSSVGGHLRGHLDAVVRGLPEAPSTAHLVDVKTASKKKFDELLKKGLRTMYPKYHAQGIGYMGHHGLERAAFIFVCKDDDRIHVERFEFDQAEFERLERRALSIVTAATPPARLSEDASWFECKFCNFHPVCHGAQVPEVNCRTCANSTPVVDDGTAGTWTCGADGITSTLSTQTQRDGCPSHLFIPPLLAALGEPVDTSPSGGVVYQAPDGGQFTNGPGLGEFGSLEIRAAADPRLLSQPDVQALKQQFPTAKVIA